MEGHEITLLMLHTGAARTSGMGWRGTLRSLFEEYFGIGTARVVEDPAVLRLFTATLHPLEVRVSDIGLQEGEVLVFGARDELNQVVGGDIREHTGNPEPDPFAEVQRADSPGRACELAAKLDQSGTGSTAFVCRMTEAEYALALSVAVEQLPDGANSTFGGRKLITDLVRTVDGNVRNRTARPGRRVESHAFERLALLMRRRNRESYYALRHAEFALYHRRTRWLHSSEAEGRTDRLICNAAAMFVEPAAMSATSLTKLLEDGVVEVGEVKITT